MTRAEQIQSASDTYLCGDKSYTAVYEEKAFTAGAEWADKNPACISVKDDTILDLAIKQVAREALKGIKPIVQTHTLRDGFEAELNEYYNAEQMMQMFQKGSDFASKYILQKVKEQIGGKK